MPPVVTVSALASVSPPLAEKSVPLLPILLMALLPMLSAPVVLRLPVTVRYPASVSPPLASKSVEALPMLTMGSAFWSRLVAVQSLTSVPPAASPTLSVPTR